MEVHNKSSAGQKKQISFLVVTDILFSQQLLNLTQAGLALLMQHYAETRHGIISQTGYTVLTRQMS